MTEVELINISVIADSLAGTQEYRVEYREKETGFVGRIMVSFEDVDDKGLDTILIEEMEKIEPLLKSLKELQKKYVGKTISI